jgi:DNA-binding beta-propeller fold protein YncE
MAIQLLFFSLNAFFIRRFLAMPLSSAIDPSFVSPSTTSQPISSDSRGAVRGDRHFDEHPRTKNCALPGRWSLALVVLCLSALAVLACSAEAQTAHFSWAISPLGSGFNSPEGVGVDASGNVFVADYGNSAVKEILAASGYTTINTLGSGFNDPQGVAVDASGNVFVADTGTMR